MQGHTDDLWQWKIVEYTRYTKQLDGDYAHEASGETQMYL